MNDYEHTPMGYEQEYHEEKHQYLYSDPYYYKARAELARRRYFKKEDSDQKILEVGVGLGQNIATFEKKVGYDISEFAVKFCKTKDVMATTNINKIPDNLFDIAISVHMLEHVENPLKTLRLVHSKLRKGGKLILITPIDKPKKIKDNKLQKDINQHLWTWTPQLMINLLIKAEFKPIENKIISTCAYKKLLPLRKIGIKTYDLATRFAGVIMRDRELKFIAVKE